MLFDTDFTHKSNDELLRLRKRVMASIAISDQPGMAMLLMRKLNKIEDELKRRGIRC